MAYILTAQLHDEKFGDTAFARYQAYLVSVRDQFPAGAYALATSAWYFDASDHRAPHDARLERVTVTEIAAPDGGPPTVALDIRLVNAYDDGWIELAYRDVSRYRVELRREGRSHDRGHQDWRYDEFRLADADRIAHEIEWWGVGPTGTWLIEAADVEYRWLPKQAASASGERGV